MVRVTIILTTTDGAGVNLLVWIMVSANGICPSLAPAKKSREEVRRVPFTAPNVEHATKKGMMEANLPYILKNYYEYLH